MPNPFVHIELSSVDLKKAEKFYKTIFGWKLQPMPEMGYTMIDVGGGTGGGMMAQRQPGAPSAWLPYVEVDDVKQAVAKATKAGAQIMQDYLEIGAMGAIAVFTDPTGAAIGVWAKGEGARAQEPAEKPAKAVAKPAAKAAAKPAAKAAAKSAKAVAKPAAKAAAKPAAKAAAKPAKAAAKPAAKAAKVEAKAPAKQAKKAPARGKK